MYILNFLFYRFSYRFLKFYLIYFNSMIMKPNGIYPIEYGILGKQFDVTIKAHQDKVYHENS